MTHTHNLFTYLVIIIRVNGEISKESPRKNHEVITASGAKRRAPCRKGGNENGRTREEEDRKA